MGTERISYRKNSFDLNNQVISWLQKYMELYLSTLDHPQWFKQVLEGLHGNFHVPHGKYFFDEEVIGNDEERLNYCVKMTEATIIQMEAINKKQFFEYIKHALKDTWCDITHDFYNDEWFSDNENYKIIYIGSLKKIKEMLK